MLLEREYEYQGYSEKHIRMKYGVQYVRQFKKFQKANLYKKKVAFKRAENEPFLKKK